MPRRDLTDRRVFTYETRAVLAAARAQGTTLTHVYDTETDTVLCGRVKVEHLADRFAHDPRARPTCRICAGRDMRG